MRAKMSSLVMSVSSGLALCGDEGGQCLDAGEMRAHFLGLGRQADADGGHPAAIPGQVVERALDLLDHEGAGVVTKGVDEGEHHDVPAVARQ